MGKFNHTLCDSQFCGHKSKTEDHPSYICNNRAEMCKLAYIFALPDHGYYDVSKKVEEYLRYRLLLENRPAQRDVSWYPQKTDEEIDAQIMQYLEHIIVSYEEDRGLAYSLRSYGVETRCLLELQDAVAQQFDSHQSTVNNKVIKYLKENIGGGTPCDTATKKLRLAVIEYTRELLRTPLYHIDFAHFHRFP